jgi:hypothetical protein
MTGDNDVALDACRNAARSFPQVGSVVNELLGKKADFGLLLCRVVFHLTVQPNGNSTFDGTNPP